MAKNLIKAAKRVLIAAAAMSAVAGAANASVIPVLTSVTPSGGNYLYTYNVTLDSDQGLTAGSKLSIFDFAGYVAGSIGVTGPAGWVASTENTSAGLLTPIGQTDNPAITNLVLTWGDGNYHTSGGPYAPTDWTLTALSTISGVVFDGFSALAVKNNGAATGTLTANVGTVEVPAVPEPATWLMMIVGFGMVGYGLRMRRRESNAMTLA